MFYKVSGKGKAVILLHGFVEEGSMWNDTAKELSKSYRVIIPDLEGFGNSALKSSALSMEYYADQVQALLQEVNVKTCVMIGHSMGGYITLHFAEKYPDMLRGFGLINSHCFEDTREKKANRKKGIEFIRQHGSELFVKEMYHSIFHPSFIQKNQRLINLLLTKAEKYSPQALIKANEAMRKRKGKEEVLKNASVPVLMINGRQDDSAPFAYTIKQAAFPSVAEVHFFNNCKHMCVFEKKKQTIKAISDFCQWV